MRTETIEEIQSVFYNFDMKISPTDFYNQCREIGFNPSVALDAIKEFFVRLERTGMSSEKMPQAWNDFMGGTERMIETLTKWKILDEKTILDFLEKDLLWLVGRSVLEDDDPFNLIKLRLYATT